VVENRDGIFVPVNKMPLPWIHLAYNPFTPELDNQSSDTSSR
jgi:hypothetical protein